MHRRGDADDLVVLSAQRADREFEAIDFVGRLLSALCGDVTIRKAITALTPAVLSWARFLPQEDVSAMVDEIVELVGATASVENLAPLAQLLIEWQHTAEIYADPELYAALTKPLTREEAWYLAQRLTSDAEAR